MDITPYLKKFCQKRNAPSTIYDMETARNLLTGKGDAALKQQDGYEDSDNLAYNIEQSVRAYSRNKDVAIRIYKDFLGFLKTEGGIDVSVEFPPIANNTFERLMFIAKYLQEPDNKVADLPDLLWVSKRTIDDDIKKLRGGDDDPIQVCGKVFTIEDLERHKGSVSFPSTAHPLFLTPNLTQVIVTLKGLKHMAEDPLYAEYAHLAATDIWEQLSDYAKARIHFVFSELLPEDLTWYESLHKPDARHFYSEVRCSGANVVMDCIKNGKTFYVEYESDEGACVYSRCRIVPRSYDGESIEVTTAGGRVRLMLDRITRSAYTAEEML